MSGKVTDDPIRQISDAFDSRDVDWIVSAFTADRPARRGATPTGSR